MPKKARKTKKTTPSKPIKETASQFDLDKYVFESLDENNDGYVTKKDLFDALASRGILDTDPRIEETVTNLKKYSASKKLSLAELQKATRHNNTIIERALKGLLVVPNFDRFTEGIQKIYQETLKNKSGANADYIPELKKVNPEQYGVSICTVDGQRLNIGDYNVPYSIQSTCKPINYCIALDDNGEKKVHSHVGREQSGMGFNDLTLNEDGLPHNPMINAGAIMSCSLIKPQWKPEKRLEYIMKKWQALSGGLEPGFDRKTFISERSTADRNFALAYFMKDHGAFPKDVNLLETLDLYFQACSIQLTAQAQAVVAGTLANGGVCPTNGKRVLKSSTAKHALSMMYSSGMYDYSGEFAFLIGLPAKSGVSGAVMLVIPNVMGITIWSPRLDAIGNSVRGIEFCQKLIKYFNFHTYDSLTQDSEKQDPRLQDNETKMRGVTAACHAGSRGDLNELERLEAQGIDFNDGDYDRRTPMHVSVDEGQEEVIKYFIAKGVNVNPRDRWGGTPLTGAIREGHKKIEALLRKHGAKR